LCASGAALTFRAQEDGTPVTRSFELHTDRVKARPAAPRPPRGDAAMRRAETRRDAC